jgi:hypothetical protein
MKSNLPEDMRLALLGAAAALKEEAKNVERFNVHLEDDVKSACRKRGRELRTHAKNLEDILFRLG